MSRSGAGCLCAFVSIRSDGLLAAVNVADTAITHVGGQEQQLRFFDAKTKSCNP